MNKKQSTQYLFCIGAQKSGTSYLYQLLKQHKAICFSKYKETHFFSHKQNAQKDFGAFDKLFSPTEQTKFLADFTPEYLPDKEALQTLSLLGKEKVKIIILLRNPINRAFSHYNMKVSRGKYHKSFEYLVNKEVYKPQKAKSVLGRSMYDRQLDNVFSLFDKESVMIETFEHFIKNKEETIHNILKFLELKEDIIINYDVYKHPQKNTRILGLGYLFFKIPLRIRRQIFETNRVIERIIKGIIEKSKVKIKRKKVIKEGTIELLKTYYANSNKYIKDKYGVDISEWQ